MSPEEAKGKLREVAYKLASEITTKKINARPEIQRISNNESDITPTKMVFVFLIINLIT